MKLMNQKIKTLKKIENKSIHSSINNNHENSYMFSDFS